MFKKYLKLKHNFKAFLLENNKLKHDKIASNEITLTLE